MMSIFNNEVNILKKQIRNKIKIIVAVALVVIAVIAGIEIKIYHSSQTKVYTFPKNLIDYAGLTVERQIEAINRDNKTKDVCTTVYANEDGSLSLELNEKQWDWWFNTISNQIKEYEKSVAQKGGKLEISEDRKSVIFEVSPDLSMEHIHSKSFLATVCAAEYQILTENTENWEVYLCFKKIDTGEIIADGTLPYDTIEFTDADIK